MKAVNLGATLQAWMILKAINQKQLSELTGLSERTISDMRKYEYSGLTSNYFAVCEALGITFDELVLGPEYLKVPLINI